MCENAYDNEDTFMRINRQVRKELGEVRDEIGRKTLSDTIDFLIKKYKGVPA